MNELRNLLEKTIAMPHVVVPRLVLIITWKHSQQAWTIIIITLTLLRLQSVDRLENYLICQILRFLLNIPTRQVEFSRSDRSNIEISRSDRPANSWNSKGLSVSNWNTGQILNFQDFYNFQSLDYFDMPIPLNFKVAVHKLWFNKDNSVKI